MNTVNGDRKREVFDRKKKRKTARERTQGPLMKIARGGTLVPWKETARVRTQELLKKTDWERTQSLSEAAAIRRKGGEFRKS